MEEKAVEWRDGFKVALCYIGETDREDETANLYQQILEDEAVLVKEQGKWTLQSTAIAQAETVDDAMREAQNLLDEVVGLLFAQGTYPQGQLHVNGTFEKDQTDKKKIVCMEIKGKVLVSRLPDIAKCQKARRKLKSMEQGAAARSNAISILKKQEQTLVAMYKLIEQMQASDPHRWKSMNALRTEYPVLDDLCDYCNDCNRSGEHARHSKHTNRHGVKKIHQYQSVNEAWEAFRPYLVPWLCWEEMPKEAGMTQSDGTDEKEEQKQTEEQASAEAVTDEKEEQKRTEGQASAEDVTQSEGMPQADGKAQEDTQE